MGEWAVLTLMQDEDQDLRNLSSETVQRAIDAVKARSWDVNPFTVADELKISRTAVYRHGDIMKQIIAARGGSFGMDVQTSLDLAWQLRQLEIQNNELKEKLAVGEPVNPSGSISQPVEEKVNGESIANISLRGNTKSGEAIFNSVPHSALSMSDYYNQLSRMSWKDIETVYHFKVSSLKDYARKLSDTEEMSEKSGIDGIAEVQNSFNKAISYGSLVSMEANKRQNLPSSISPFARLKSGSSKLGAELKEVDSEKKVIEQAYIDTGEHPIIPAVDTSLSTGEQSIVVSASPDTLLRQETAEPQASPAAPLFKNQTEMRLSGKRIEELESDLMRLASQLQNDLAERIRTGLGQEGQYRETYFQEISPQEIHSQEIVSQQITVQKREEQEIQEIHAAEIPISAQSNSNPEKLGDWLSFESPKASEQSGGWAKFANQPPPLEPFFSDVSKKIKLSQQLNLSQLPTQPPAQLPLQAFEQPPGFEFSHQAQEFEQVEQAQAFEQIEVTGSENFQQREVFEVTSQAEVFEDSKSTKDTQQYQTFDRLPKLHGFEHNPQSLEFQRTSQPNLFALPQPVEITEAPPLVPSIEQAQLWQQKEQNQQPPVQEPEIKKEPEIKLIPLFKDPPSMPLSTNPDLGIDQNLLLKGKSKNTQINSGIQSIIDQINASQVAGNAGAPRDELRDLIQSHIKNAAEQIAELGSIGSGKEYEVWLNNPGRSKFVGSTKEGVKEGSEEEEAKPVPKNAQFKPRVVPPDVRKACLILGLRPDNITYEAAQDAWKKAIAAPGVHPDLGGDTELAVYLNTAKDVLMRFLDAQAPKLGKKFGPFKAEKDGKTKPEKSEKTKDDK